MASNKKIIMLCYHQNLKVSSARNRKDFFVENWHVMEGPGLCTNHVDI